MPFDKETASEAGKKSSRSGTPNRSTSELKQLLQTILENNLETLEQDLRQMKPEQRVQAILNIASYILPKQKAIDLNTPIDSPIIWHEVTNYS